MMHTTSSTKTRIRGADKHVKIIPSIIIQCKMTNTVTPSTTEQTKFGLHHPHLT